MEGIVDTLTTTQPPVLLKHLEFHLLVNLEITQKVLVFTNGITSRPQKKAIDIMEAYEMFSKSFTVRVNIDTFHHNWFEQEADLARKLNIEATRI